MAQDIIFLLILIGGFIGWSLLGYTLFQFLIRRKKEINMINNISEDLKKIKEDVRSLK